MTVQILEEIKSRLAQRFPGYGIYVDACPQGCEKPAFLLEQTGLTTEDAGRWTVLVTARFTVTYYPPPDGGALAATITAVKHGVGLLFADGCLRTAGRAVKTAVNGGSRDFDWASVDLQFSWYDDRPERPEQAMQAETVITNVTQEGRV